MSAKSLANHYSQLTPEERFRLFMAAGSRGDKVEGDRLMNAGKRISLSVPDHAPYAHAFRELLLMTYIEMLEDAAFFLESYALSDKQLHDIIEAARTCLYHPRSLLL